MTDDELNTLMAEKVMRGKRQQNWDGSDVWWIWPDGTSTRGCDWCPTEIIGQAFMCLEKLGNDGWYWSISAGDFWPFRVHMHHSDDDREVEVTDEKPARAIVLAIVQALEV